MLFKTAFSGCIKAFSLHTSTLRWLRISCDAVGQFAVNRKMNKTDDDDGKGRSHKEA